MASQEVKDGVLRTLEDKITLYRHLGISFLELSSTRTHLKVQLTKNLNHKGTAFGGSLYTAAVLGAYSLVLTGLRSRGIPTENIVIAKGAMEYFRPVASDFEVVCEFVSSLEEDLFYQELQDKHRVRREIKSQILADGGSVRAEFSGVFVVKL